MAQYEVKVARTLVETAVVTVEADSVSEAEALAIDISPEFDTWSVYDSSTEVIDVFQIEE